MEETWQVLTCSINSIYNFTFVSHGRVVRVHFGHAQRCRHRITWRSNVQSGNYINQLDWLFSFTLFVWHFIRILHLCISWTLYFNVYYWKVASKQFSHLIIRLARHGPSQINQTVRSRNFFNKEIVANLWDPCISLCCNRFVQTSHESLLVWSNEIQLTIKLKRLNTFL